MKRGLNAEERSYLITAVVVVCAIAARVISKEGIAADTMGLIRSVLYIGLYFVWGISIKKRVMQAQVQRYLTAIVGMMIFCSLSKIPAIALSSSRDFHILPEKF